MRIGLLTLPLETGYGSILQAYALKTVLTRQGHEVILIRRLVKKKRFNEVSKNTYSENLPAFSTTRKSTTNTP